MITEIEFADDVSLDEFSEFVVRFQKFISNEENRPLIKDIRIN